ncbi:phosphonatase-like hydrolase [Zobellia roscoffensis]|uniref:phosphonatase-like hydrolase n=1 Tax=Zobellia roscoffensis TaxID=2779508 RepID=UPI00188D9229|nr:phosphonatase-like hydrolase [Zobellia roscoffensis]
MKNIELVVFDMAGTTVNEDNVVYKTLCKAINQKGHSVTLDFVLEHGAGKEKHQAIKDVLAAKYNSSKFEIESQDIFNDFKIQLNEAYDKLEVKSYNGIEELITVLKKSKIKIALNTGYSSKIANLLLTKMGWQLGMQYDTLITADDVSNGRPQPDMILKAMEELKIKEPLKVLKAGDSAIDVEEGKNAGCGITIGVTTGAQTRKQLEQANPTYVLDSLIELSDILV